MTDGKKGWRQEMPDFLQFLETALGHHVRLHEEVLGYHLYFVDLSAWKLRFSDRTPVIWVGEGRSGRAAAARARPEPGRRHPDPRRWPSATPSSLVQGPGQELRGQLQDLPAAAAGAGPRGADGHARVAAAHRRAARPPERPARPVAADALRNQQTGDRLPLLRPRVRGAPHPAGQRQQLRHHGHPAHRQDLADARDRAPAQGAGAGSRATRARPSASSSWIAARSPRRPASSRRWCASCGPRS